VKFQSKMKQSVDMITEINSAYGQPVRPIRINDGRIA
jgi:hypothetical protein